MMTRLQCATHDPVTAPDSSRAHTHTHPHTQTHMQTHMHAPARTQRCHTITRRFAHPTVCALAERAVVPAVRHWPTTAAVAARSAPDARRLGLLEHRHHRVDRRMQPAPPHGTGPPPQGTGPPPHGTGPRPHGTGPPPHGTGPPPLARGRMALARRRIAAGARLLVCCAASSHSCALRRTTPLAFEKALMKT